MHNDILFDPCGIVDLAITPRAPRNTKLDGLRLGVLDNSKWNANKLLRGAVAALGENIMFAAVNYYVKHSFSKDAAPELIKQIAQENDVVLTAIGDCGSCCSCCIRDAIELEKLGIPSAAIITTEFVRETELIRRALGMPNFEAVVIDHPVSSITKVEISARVRQIKDQAEKIWVGPSNGVSAFTRTLAALILSSAVASPAFAPIRDKSSPPANTPSVLPRPDFHFPGNVGRTYLDSAPAQFPQPVQGPKGAPNIVLILIDDVGFGQFSTFGGGVPSPTMDKLAAEGLRYNSFHTTALCS